MVVVVEVEEDRKVRYGGMETSEGGEENEERSKIA